MVPAIPADVPRTGHNVKPGEQPPAYPVAALAKTQAGANAFAKFFMQTLDWAYATTNPSYMRHYYGPTCGLCASLSLSISKTAEMRHFYEGDRLVIGMPKSTGIAPVTAPAEFCALVSIDETAFTTVDAAGRIYTGDGAHRGDNFKLCVKHSGFVWSTTYLAGQ